MPSNFQKIGIITVAREPESYRHLFQAVTWPEKNATDQGWPPEVQEMLNVLYQNSGIGDSVEDRQRFWVSFFTDSLNPSPVNHPLGLWESQFLLSIFPDQFYTC